ncbi:hypothetical protein Tco_1053372, partial [Tanacetum coccineum]
QNGVAERKNRILIEAARTIGIKPVIGGFIKPFGCHVTILNTLDKLGKFDGKSDEGIQGVSESSTSSQQDQDNQDYIVMPIWKEASYFYDASPRSIADAQIQDQNGTHDNCSLQNNGTADKQVNTASLEVNTGSREVVTPSNLSMQRNVEYPKALHYWVNST